MAKGDRKYTLTFKTHKNEEKREFIYGMNEAHDRAEALCKKSKKHTLVKISDNFGLTCTVTGCKGKCNTDWADS